MKIELKMNKAKEIEEERDADDWCSADMLLIEVFHHLVCLNWVWILIFLFFKGLYFILFKEHKIKILKFLLILKGWKQRPGSK